VLENLDIARRLHAIKHSNATARVIERLRLGAYANRKAGTLSTGNLQRLGLARALLHEPELLILDEPANGLDPAGVVEIRELLESLAHEKGVTIFMSSHILTEVDRLATRIGIIHMGRLIEELDTDALERLRSKRLEVKARNLEAARICIQNAGYNLTLNNEMILIEDAHAVACPDEIARLMVESGTPPTRLAVEQQDLEDHFLQLTGGTK
jgi:ABC-2 type transport system ATP-binding protein